MIHIEHTRSHLRLAGHSEDEESGPEEADRVCSAVSTLVGTYCLLLKRKHTNPIRLRRCRSAAYRFLLTGLRHLAQCYPQSITLVEDALDAPRPGC